MQARYGHKWTSTINGIEELAVREWSEGLTGFTGEEIRRGLEWWDDEWPPSLPEFKEACRGSQHNENAAMYREFKPALPEPDWRKQERKESAKNGVAAMREKLRG